MTDRSEPTTAADRLRDWINGDHDFTHAEPNRWLDEALAEARQPSHSRLRESAVQEKDSEALHPPPDDWREALEWALDNLDAEDEVIGDAMSWAVTAHGKTVTMARSTEYEAGKQKARAILAALPPSDPPALDDVQHALKYINAALDKASYGDAVEGDLLEAHATLDSLIARLSAQPEAQPAEDTDGPTG